MKFSYGGLNLKTIRTQKTNKHFELIILNCHSVLSYSFELCRSRASPYFKTDLKY